MKSTMAQLSAIMKRTYHDAPALERCTECPGWIVPGRFDSARLPKLDEAGAPILDGKGNPTYTVLRMQHHALPPSMLDPTGLGAASCTHGAIPHPVPEIFELMTPSVRGQARSWIRTRYLNTKGECPVCLGKPEPEDMKTPAALPA